MTDVNDGESVAGATVTASNGDTTRTGTTFAGGAYQLDELHLQDGRFTRVGGQR